jgi:hypothetical protein
MAREPLRRVAKGGRRKIETRDSRVTLSGDPRLESETTSSNSEGWVRAETDVYSQSPTHKRIPCFHLGISLTLPEFDSHRLKCADIIRNAVDSTDYKDYIYPLVYYKTISVNHKIQYEQYIEE